jgi:hypothetical protein
VIAGFSADEYTAPGSRLCDESRALRGLLSDAARFAPELAPLVAPIVEAPIVAPGYVCRAPVLAPLVEPALERFLRDGDKR